MRYCYCSTEGQIPTPNTPNTPGTPDMTPATENAVTEPAAVYVYLYSVFRS